MQDAKTIYQRTGGALAHTWNLAQFRCPVANLAALAVEGYSEAMGFVSNKLDQMQHRVVVIECNRIIFLSTDVNNLFALGNRSERLVDDLQRRQRLGGCVKLAQSPIYENQAWHLFSLVEELFFLNPFVAARHHLAHGSKIVHTRNGADDELPIVRLLHAAIFPNDH